MILDRKGVWSGVTTTTESRKKAETAIKEATSLNIPILNQNGKGEAYQS